MSREITDAINEAYSELRIVNKQDYHVDRRLREQNFVYEQLVDKIGAENANKVWADIYERAKIKEV